MESRATVSHTLGHKHAQAPPPPVDFEAEDEDENLLGDEGDFYVSEEEDEEPHYWLHIPTAAKFLLAGGVAGAGLFITLINPELPLTGILRSIANMHCAIRSTKDIPDHTATRSRRHLAESASTCSRRESHRGCRNANICRRRYSCILDWERSLCREDLTRVGN